MTPKWKARDEMKDRVWSVALCIVVFMSGAVLGLALALAVAAR